MPKTIGHWCKQLQTELERKGRTNWEGDYWKILRRLPQGEPLTKPKMIALIDSTEPNSKTRVRCCMAIAALCRVAGHRFDPSPYRGNYSAKKAKIREIPTDATLAEYWAEVRNPDWKWVLGMIITYGLRPHETFYSSVDREGLCSVSEGKTGPRNVWPFHPEWVQAFRLHDQRLPNVDIRRQHDKVGRSASRYFWEQNAPFVLYDCRHAYALRLMEYGVETADAARWMGHSVIVHTQLYQKWVDQKRDRAAMEKVLARSDRPLPPGLNPQKNA